MIEGTLYPNTVNKIPSPKTTNWNFFLQWNTNQIYLWIFLPFQKLWKDSVSVGPSVSDIFLSVSLLEIVVKCVLVIRG